MDILISNETQPSTRLVLSLPVKGKEPFDHRLRFIANQDGY